MPRLGSRPVLLIHGMNDTLIPVAHAYRLQQAGAANPHLQLWVAPAAEHVRAFRVYPDAYLQRVFAFFDQNLP